MIENIPVTELIMLQQQIVEKDAEIENLLEVIDGLYGAMPPHILKKWPNITAKAQTAIKKKRSHGR